MSSTPTTRVLIAGVSTRAMAESAARAGYAVTTLDAFGDLDQHDGVRALSVPRDFGVAFTADAAARAAGTVSCDAVAYLSPFENHPKAVDRLANGRTLWGNSPSTLERVRDPFAFVEALARHGVVAPDVRRGDAPLSRIDGNGRWLIKPHASGGGHSVRPWIPGNAVPPGCYLQRFIDGVPASIVFAATSGHATPLALTSQIVGDDAFGATGFRYCGSILAPATDARLPGGDALTAAATRLASTVTREFDLVGVNGIDFIAADGVPVPIEVNPRYSASMELVERAYGLSIFATHVAGCLYGDLKTFDLPRMRTGMSAFGKAIVFARHDIVCGDTRPWLDDPTVRDVPHPDEHILAGRPVCTVFARGVDSAACYASLVRRGEQIYTMLESWASATV